MKLLTRPPSSELSIPKPVFFLCIIVLLLLSIYFVKEFQKKENETKESTFILEKISSKPIRFQKEKDGFVIDIQNSSISYCYPNQQCKKKIYPRPYLNTLLSPKMYKSAPQISDLLRMYGIPVPRYVILNRLNMGKTFPQNYPIVLKPITSSDTHDIYTDIENYAEYTQIRDELLKRYERIMMVDQILGEHYRIYLFAGDVMDIILRIRPFVTGDGKHTIRQLIEMRNQKRIQNKQYPTRMISEKYIDQQGYSINSILTNGVTIFITQSISYQNGADSKHIPVSKIPKENIALFKKAIQIVGFECGMIDYVSPDITQSYQTPPDHSILNSEMVYQADRSFGTIITIHDKMKYHIMKNKK